MSEANGSTNGRDPRGLFAKGNRIASGNPINKRMRELRQSLFDCTTEADIVEIKTSLMESVRSGDTAAARVLLEYLIGKPVQAVELSGRDGGSLGPDLAGLTETILAALASYPDARLAVAARLKEVGRGHDDGPGDRAGD